MKVLFFALVTLVPLVAADDEYVYDNKCNDKKAVMNCHDCDFDCLPQGWEMKTCKCDCKFESDKKDITYKIKYDCDKYNCDDSKSCDSDDDCKTKYLSTSDDEDCYDEGSESRCEDCCWDKCKKINDEDKCEEECYEDCVDDADCEDAGDEKCDFLETSEDRSCRNKESESKCEDCCWDECVDENRGKSYKCKERCYDDCVDDADCEDASDDDKKCDDYEDECCDCIEKCVRTKKGLKQEKKCVRSKCKGKCKDAAEECSGWSRSEWKHFFDDECSYGFDW